MTLWRHKKGLLNIYHSSFKGSHSLHQLFIVFNMDTIYIADGDITTLVYFTDLTDLLYVIRAYYIRQQQTTVDDISLTKLIGSGVCVFYKK